MNTDTFSKNAANFLSATVEKLLKKGEEYAEKEDDRLIAFKTAAALQRETPQKALSGMLAKHIVSIYQMCNNPKANSYSLEKWHEKIGDSINYLVLLEGIIKEELDENSRQ